MDFGVGDGRHVEYLMSLGYDVTGTDVAPASLDVTKRVFAGNGRFSGFSLENAPELPARIRLFSHHRLGGAALVGFVGKVLARDARIQARAAARQPHFAHDAQRKALLEAAFPGDRQEHLLVQDANANGLYFLLTEFAHPEACV